MGYNKNAKTSDIVQMNLLFLNGWSMWCISYPKKFSWKQLINVIQNI